MWRRFLCLIGWHEWVDSNPRDPMNYDEVCEYCGRDYYYDD